MSHGKIAIEIGATYSNDLAEKYLEHRRVTGMASNRVQFLITRGRREGATGSCPPPAFWHWQRRKLD